MAAPAHPPRSDSPPLDAAVRELIRVRAQLAAGAELPDGLLLGASGLGLDSIAVVELLLDCERRFGVPRPVELLDGPPLTVGRLVDHLRALTEP